MITIIHDAPVTPKNVSYNVMYCLAVKHFSNSVTKPLNLISKFNKKCLHFKNVVLLLSQFLLIILMKSFEKMDFM